MGFQQKATAWLARQRRDRGRSMILLAGVTNWLTLKVVKMVLRNVPL